MRSHRRSIEWWHWRYLKWLIIFPIYTLLDRPSYIRWRHSGHIWSCEALLTEDTGLTAEPWMMPADSLASVMLTLEMSCSVDGQKSTIKLSIGSEIFNKASLQGLGKIKSRRWSQTYVVFGLRLSWWYYCVTFTTSTNIDVLYTRKHQIGGGEAGLVRGREVHRVLLLRFAFQSQTNTEKILYNESRQALIMLCYRTDK